MSAKEQTIGSILAADITRLDWVFRVVSACPDAFARGYLSAQVEFFDAVESQSSEAYRDSLLEACESDIWANNQPTK